VFNFVICGGIGGRSKIRSIIPQGMIFKSTLHDLGHPQPKILVHCDNATAVGITNNTIKWQRSRAMEMRYFWTCEKDPQDMSSFSRALTAIGAHERQLFDKLIWLLATSTILSVGSIDS
jgi:hypothetical protein